MSDSRALQALVNPKTGIYVDAATQEYVAIAVTDDGLPYERGRCAMEMPEEAISQWRRAVWGHLIAESGG